MEILRRLDKVWNEYVSRIKIVCNAFLFLDRVYVLNRTELASIWDFSMQLFRTNAMGDIKVKEILVPAILSTIQYDRRSEMSEVSTLLADIISMLTDLKLLDDWIREKVAQETTEFFIERAEEKLRALPIPNYLEYTRHRIDSEHIRYGNYGLDPRLATDLIHRVQDALFISRIDGVLETGLNSLALEPNMKVLKLLYGLCRETDQFGALKNHLLALIKSRGSTIISDTSKDEVILGDLIDWKDRLDAIYKTAFDQNSIFEDAIKDGFESVMNSRQNRPAELIAKYIDYQMRGAGLEKALTEEQLNVIIEKVITMFRFIQGKDIFESYFKKDLSRRLLLSRSVSIDAEKNFVANLKQECGSAFTSRLEGMFKDIEVSKSTMYTYEHSERYDKKQARKMDFQSAIITSGLWPYPPLISVNLPTEVVDQEKQFEEFYKGQHKGRVLNWHQGLGHCVLKGYFPLGVKELQVSIPQAVILTQFNDQEELSYPEIRDRTALDDLTLTRALQSLACGKISILVKSPSGREVSIGDRFAFNTEFASKHQRIRINAGSSRDSVEEPSMISPEVPSDKQYQIDAAIVRVLKLHKKLSRDRLIELASEQVKFSISQGDFNRRMPSLIEREYVGQDPETPGMYIYIS